MNASEYLKHWRGKKIWTHNMWPKHQDRLKWCAGQCVGETFLDLGCAFGHSTNIMRGFHYGNWTGIDFSEEAVAEARHFFPDIPFVFLRNIEDGADLKFDTVICSEVIEHVENDAAFVAGLVRMTRMRLVLTTPCRDAHDPGHLRIYDDESISRLLKGLEVNIDKGEFFFHIVLNPRRGE